MIFTKQMEQDFHSAYHQIPEPGCAHCMLEEAKEDSQTMLDALMTSKPLTPL